jgi:YidC/Oxa1 family membrane protein insertase
MDRKTILAFALILLVAFLYPTYNRLIFKKHPPQKDTTAAPSTPSTTDSAAVAAVTAAPPEIHPDTTALLKPETTLLATDTAVPAGRTITVETEQYIMTLSTSGAGITSFRCKHYRNSNTGELTELMRPGASGALDIALGSGTKEVRFANALFIVDREGLILDKSQVKDSLTFTYAAPYGLTVTKTIVFYNDKYYFDAFIALSWKGRLDLEEYRLAWMPGLAITEKDSGRDQQGFGWCYKKTGEKPVSNRYKGKTTSDRGRVEWLAAKSKYFTVALAPLEVLKTGQTAGVTIREGAKDNRARPISLELSMPLANHARHLYRVYIGPLSYPQLKDMEIGLERVLDFGWWIIRPVSVVIYHFCMWLYPYVKNYGVVIIIFSVLIKVLFYPLTAKSMAAAKDMQKLQPLMAEVKAKYKNDPQAQNQEMMKLYKQQKVNPLGGCLPMLPQMPVFFALFKVFDNAIEFRQAPFAFWLTDLSCKDPTYILPIFMGASTFLQMKMTTDTSNQQQKMMLYIMPVVLTFIFMGLSSGLILYYTIFNLLSIGQQYLMKRTEKAAGVTPALVVKK